MTGCWIWGLLVVIAAVVFWMRGALPQDLQYHALADTRTFAGIPNFGNVISNVPFVLVGLYGFGVVWRLRNVRKTLQTTDSSAFTIFCIGVTLTGIGSAYYHWAPSNDTLMWDRLPMTIAFAGLLAMVVSDRVSPRLAAWLLIPLACAGAASVFYWDYTEALGRGDLRPYAIVQYVPLLMLPAIAVGFTSRYLKTSILMHALVWYVLAKVLEAGDHRVFDAWKAVGVEVVSGHTLKHLAAAVGPWVVVRGIEREGLPGGGAKH